MLSRIAAILEQTARGKGPLRPTALFNEGWMLSLILDAAARQPDGIGFLRFAEGATWYSEALLASPFVAQHRGDPLGEGRTHADAVVGHFNVGNVGKGDFSLSSSATQFVVLEAKVFSGLSSGTTRVPGYDQAARNVACMATALQTAQLQPGNMADLVFAVVAPQERIAQGVFGNLVTAESIRMKVEARVKAYCGKKDDWLKEWFIPTLDALTLRLVPWEDLVGAAGEEYGEFYSNCLKYNRSGAMALG